jgi:hypothetical protein
MVTFLIEHELADERDEAILVGKQLMSAGIFEHVYQDHWLEDNTLFYRFRQPGNDSPGQGETQRDARGSMNDDVNVTDAAELEKRS